MQEAPAKEICKPINVRKRASVLTLPDGTTILIQPDPKNGRVLLTLPEGSQLEAYRGLVNYGAP